MGGIGSGRTSHYSSRNTTNHYRRLNVNRLHQCGRLAAGQSYVWQWTADDQIDASIHIRTESDKLILAHRQRCAGNDWQNVTYPVNLDWSACHLGGERPWFICPAHGCGRRVAVLYGGKIFACRHCHKLAYVSQREAAHDRAARRVDKLRHRLGWEWSFFDGNGSKPKGMHWKTFHALCAQHQAFLRISLSGVLMQLDKVEKNHDSWCRKLAEDCLP